MIDKPIYVTHKGLEELKAELDHLRNVRLLEVVAAMQEVTEGGDWMDNAECQLVSDELAFVEARIQELDYMIQQAQIIEVVQPAGVVRVGNTAVLQVQGNGRELEQYTIVGIIEADPARGFISNESPMGQAILNHKVGDEVDVKVPDGLLHVRILAIK